MIRRIVLTLTSIAVLFLLVAFAGKFAIEHFDHTREVNINARKPM